MEPPRILLCLSSLPRCFSVAFPSLQRHVIDRLPSKPDIVAHFPPSARPEAISCLEQAAEKCVMRIEEDPELPQEFLQFSENMSPAQTHGIRGNLLQWHSMQCCNDLKEELESQQGTYDWIIWSRPDLYFLNDLPPIQTLNNDAIYVPSHDCWHGYNDRFCVGNSAIIGKRMRIYDYFTKKWYPRFHNEKEALFACPTKNSLLHCWNPERVLMHYLLYELKVAVFPLSLIFGKLRVARNRWPPRKKSRYYYISKPMQKACADDGVFEETPHDDTHLYNAISELKTIRPQKENTPCIRLEELEPALSAAEALAD